VSKRAREQVKVCISGEGADELFVGYPTYSANYLYAVGKHIPRPLLKGISSLVSSLSVSDKKLSFENKLKRFMQGLSRASITHAHPMWRMICSHADKAMIMQPAFHEAIVSDAVHERYFGRMRGDLSLPESLANADLHGFLLYNNLVRTDVYSMRNALEVRVPFLHLPLVEYVSRLPFSLRYRLFQSNCILKSITRPSLDSAIIRRPKAGWHMPISTGLKSELYDYTHELFNSSHRLFDSMLDRSACTSLLREHKAGRENNAYKIWGLSVLLRTVHS